MILVSDWVYKFDYYNNYILWKKLNGENDSAHMVEKVCRTLRIEFYSIYLRYCFSFGYKNS